MAKFTNRPRENFTQVRNKALLDKNLSLKAKGLLTIMLSRPDNWTFYMTWIEAQSSDGRHAVRAAMQELINFNYVIREKERGEDGKFSYTYSVGDMPVEPQHR